MSISLSRTGFVIWLTGLPASGKTTLAEAFVEKHKSSNNFKVPGFKILDGDVLRKNHPELGFSKEDRFKQAEIVAKMAADYEYEGYAVIVALVSPYEKSRARARSVCNNFFEVYISTPLQVCIARDPKGLYKKALCSEILNFTGITDPYEVPVGPDLIIDTSLDSVEAALLKIYQLISVS